MKKGKRLLVRVTQDDIDRGKPQDAGSCAIARVFTALGFQPQVCQSHIGAAD